MIKSRIERDRALVPASGKAIDEPKETTFSINQAQWDFESKVKAWYNVSTGAFNVSTGALYSTSSNKEREFPCHEKMKGKERPYADELKPHWERARKLGLASQVDAIEKMALKKDIEDLTQGAGYPEVSDQDLEIMFEFPRLRRKMWWHNKKAQFSRWFTLSGDGAIVLRLKKDDASRAGVPIPFGAQLRMEEAKERGIFDSFQVVYPNIITEAALAAERARERDPALVGLAGGVMYLICSWDLPKDVQKADADIATLKALKIEF